MITFAPFQIMLAARKIADRHTHENVSNTWPYGEFMCHLWHVVLYINMFVQIIFLTLMAIDRYLAVVRHGRLMKLSSYRNSRAVIGEYNRRLRSKAADFWSSRSMLGRKWSISKWPI